MSVHLPANPTGTWDFPRRDLAGAYGILTSGDVLGHGRHPGGSEYHVTPHTSTRKRLVPTGKGTTNPVYLVKVQGGDRPVHVTGFTLQGTPQGHPYNGVRVDRAAGPHASVEVAEVRTVAIPGTSDVNPGETFAVNLYRCRDVHVHDVEVDGAGVGASGLGLNTCTGPLLVEDYTAHDLRWCKGIALWRQADGGTIRRFESLGNAFAVGFERCAGRYVLDRPKFRGSTRADLHVASDVGRCTVEVVDPDLKPGQKVTVLLPAKELGASNRQRRSDVTVTVGGEARPDLLRFVTKA